VWSDYLSQSYSIYYSMGQIVQVAQLLQRDRAAGWVIVLTKSERLERGDNKTIFCEHYRSIFNHCDVSNSVKKNAK